MNKKLTSKIALASLLFNLLTPAAYASTTLEISGNGADSDNDVQITRTSETNVVQSNEARINNDVKVEADTGDNQANKNTGGSVGIDTGDADVVVSVDNQANSNSVDLQNCDCNGDVEVLISENGADSDNDANLTTSDTTLVVQGNRADIDNKIDAEAETGDNQAGKNTGGDVMIDTGDATITLAAKTEANANSAKIGGGGSGSVLSARILGNGADSENTINLGVARALSVVQSNFADVENRINAEAETGDNQARKNTGGSVGIDTGDADVLVGVENMVNFNEADVDCDCFLEDITAKIAGNGTDAKNLIAAEIGDSLGVFQYNCGEDDRPSSDKGWDPHHGHGRDNCKVDNKVDAEAESGDNDVRKSTGDYTGDPSVETGDADATVLLETAGNVNTVGSQSSDLDLGGTGIDFDFSINLNLADLLAFLGLGQ